jgi:hypothetical protein
LKIEWIQPSEVGQIPELTPATDETLLSLFDRALKGELLVYFAAVPFRLIEAFDKTYDPRRHPAGRAAVDEYSKEWEEGHFHPSWVYPKEERFILSDDYISYFACIEGQPEYIPCWVLGRPEHPDVRDIQGPINPDNIRELMGLV